MESQPIEVLWRSDVLVAVNKPAGLPTQAAGDIQCVESVLRQQWDRQDAYLAFPHRLDRNVSGVLLVAWTKRAANLLSQQFATRKTAKQYLAIVQGLIDPSICGRWEDYVRKVQEQAKAECCEKDAEGAKLAITEMTVINTDSQNQLTRLQLNPITGRMHQLRVQAAHRGHPIIGDEDYGANAHARQNHSDDSFNRIMLHAEQIAFHDPQNGKRLTVQADCPF